MDPKDQRPSSTPDPQWDELVARLQAAGPLPRRPRTGSDGDQPADQPGDQPGDPAPSGNPDPGAAETKRSNDDPTREADRHTAGKHDPADTDTGSGGQPDPGTPGTSGNSVTPGPAGKAGNTGPESHDERLRRLFTTGPGASGPRDYALQEEPDGEFVPEDPVAIGSGDPVLTLAWLAAAGGPLALLLGVIFFRGAPTALFIALGLITLAGVGLLLYRLPNDRDPGDDGARV
ncbi:hypothetical protein [Glutamicibacter creatinolyticus]|uniref:hypothetical protein n=1 Tax=Glutamicibacter creatinolyticus TaxID=162496 RepID=UPI001110684A|nr:hypothetical protein [Glutamicibacter creatinolyticus]